MKYQKELNLSVGLCRHSLATNGSADLRSPEKEVCFRSWDLAHHQIYKSILYTQKLIKNLNFI